MILIVDDQLYEIFAAVLKTADLVVVGFGTGGEGLEWARRNKAELIILDLALPDISGMKVAEKMREMGVKTKIIFITGHLDKFDYIWAEELECPIFLKPFDAKEFIELVKRNL
jgi:DNA-binding response OmpR family regulator